MENLLDSIINDGAFVARLVIAMLLGGIIGLERQSRGRSAGLRTNILVCLGSAAVIVAFQKLYVDADPGVQSAIRFDPARAAAGVITGIGFLGAGTIVKSKDFVRGLTTAASIWVVSAVGIIVGLGEYTISVALTLLVLLTLFVLHRINIGTDQYAPLYLAWSGELSVLDELKKQLENCRVQIKHCSVTRHPNTGLCRATLHLRYRDETPVNSLFVSLQEDKRFDEITWG